MWPFRLAAAVAGLIGLRLGSRRPRRIEPWMEEFHSNGRSS